MSTTLILAIITITLALVFYTIGVWSERRSGILKKWHLMMFSFGLLFDVIGTTLMSKIADSEGITLHGITGFIAIVLMLVHTIWAIVTLIRNKDKELEEFHKFSIIVWFIWLVPYLLGMMIGMM